MSAAWADAVGTAVCLVFLFVSAWWAGRIDERRKKEGRK